MGCGEALVKYILFFTNLVFSLAGLALLGLGVAAQIKIAAVTNVLEANNLSVAPVTSMVVGGIVFLIAFFGCCGAIRESNCMLVTYAIFMLLLMVAKVALSVLIFVKLDTIVEDIPNWMNESFSRDPTKFSELEKVLVSVVFGLCLANHVRNKNRRSRY